MTKMKVDLKPCPFCGGEAKIQATITHSVPNYSRHYCYCKECLASGESFTDTSQDGSSVFKAIESWNRRTEPPTTLKLDVNGFSDYAEFE